MDAVATRRRGRPPGVNRMELSVRQSEAFAFVDELRRRAFVIGEAVYNGWDHRALNLLRELQTAATEYESKWIEAAG